MPQSSGTSLWRMLMRLPFLHCKAWSTVIFSLNPSQVCLSTCGCRNNRIRRLYLHSSVDRVVLFRRSGTTVINATDTVALLSPCLPLLVSLHFSLYICSSSLSYLIPRSFLLLLRTQALCYDMDRASPVIRDSNRRFLHVSEVLWLLSAVSVRFGTLVPELLAPKSSSLLSLPEMLSITNSFVRNLFAKDCFTGPCII